MSRKINCNVITPEGPAYKGEIDFAVIPAFDGEMGFLFNHAPLLAGLGAGEVRLRDGQDTDYLYIEGGFAEIINNELTIFPLKASLKEELLKEDIDAELKNLKDLYKTAPQKEKDRLTSEITKTKAKLKTAKKAGKA